MIYPSKVEAMELTGPERSFCKQPRTNKGFIIPQTGKIPDSKAKDLITSV